MRCFNVHLVFSGGLNSQVNGLTLVFTVQWRHLHLISVVVLHSWQSVGNRGLHIEPEKAIILCGLMCLQLSCHLNFLCVFLVLQLTSSAKCTFFPIQTNLECLIFIFKWSFEPSYEWRYTCYTYLLYVKDISI